MHDRRSPSPAGVNAGDRVAGGVDLMRTGGRSGNVDAARAQLVGQRL